MRDERISRPNHRPSESHPSKSDAVASASVPMRPPEEEIGGVGWLVDAFVAKEDVLWMVSFEMNDQKKIGLGLTGFGIFFSFLGIIFFFDKALLAMGNILFLSGLMLTIGLKSTLQFFAKPKNYKGTISFGAGFFLVLVGWPVIGMILESYGFIVLFSGFWSILAVFLQKIPILGWIFQQPFVTSFFDRHGGKRVPV
ncbi:hypothetical protein C4D60_Mb00t02380 [Musa balbisiana]|uniref:Vesicle transport protein n=2 Tax=Musa TaxID=4640 RepID=A0A4S8I5W0_MUSBA|nr:hypothetical protein C4D60_Mb00t02380 [Musa balbisiana]